MWHNSMPIKQKCIGAATARHAVASRAAWGQIPRLYARLPGNSEKTRQISQLILTVGTFAGETATSRGQSNALSEMAWWLKIRAC
jgi:hypothetical protein